MQIRSEVLFKVAKMLTDRQTNNDDYISSLAEVTSCKHCCALYTSSTL